MAQFHDLIVTDVHNTIRDAVVLTLQPQGDADFSYIPGQYLTFRRDFDGQELRRSYSICAGLDDGKLQVGIKKVAGGAFSSWANDHLKPGDVVQAMAPMGSFHTPIDPEHGKSYLGFAGGSGITPILSILRTVLAREPNSQFTLVYANRAVNTVMFREELEDLKNTYLERLSLVHILETESPDTDLFTGRVDGDKCAALFQSWIDIAAVDTAFICGPEPMMLAIRDALQTHGLSPDQIKFELFASGQPGRLKRPVGTDQSDAAGIPTTVILDGTAHSFDAPRDMTLLDAARAQDIDAPYACKAGVCSTCKCRVLKGSVEMVANHALEDYEVDNGFVLSCQSFATSDEVTIDFDQH